VAADMASEFRKSYLKSDNSSKTQGDHLSGKPGNIGEFGTCQGCC